MGRLAEVAAACDSFSTLLQSFAEELDLEGSKRGQDDVVASHVQSLQDGIMQLKVHLQERQEKLVAMAEPRLEEDLTGRLPDTVEVHQLLEQLDNVNGTIRALDEMLAAASFNLGLADDCFGMLPTGTVALVGASAQALGPTPATVPGLPPIPNSATLPGRPSLAGAQDLVRAEQVSALVALPSSPPPARGNCGVLALGRLEDAEDTAHIASMLCSPLCSPEGSGHGQSRFIEEAVALPPGPRTTLGSISPVRCLSFAAALGGPQSLEVADLPKVGALRQVCGLDSAPITGDETKMGLAAIPPNEPSEAVVACESQAPEVGCEQMQSEQQQDYAPQAPHASRPAASRPNRMALRRGPLLGRRAPKLEEVKQGSAPVDSDAIELFSQDPASSLQRCGPPETALEREQEEARQCRRQRKAAEIVLAEPPQTALANGPGLMQTEPAAVQTPSTVLPAAMMAATADSRAATKTTTDTGVTAAGVASTGVESATMQKQERKKQDEPSVIPEQQNEAERFQSKQLVKPPVPVLGTGTVIEVTDADETSPLAERAAKRTEVSSQASVKRRRSGNFLLSQQLKLSASQRLRSSTRRTNAEAKRRRTKGGWILDRPHGKSTSSSKSARPPELEVQISPPAAASREAVVLAEDQLQVLFSGFARQDMTRMKKSVERLGGAVVRELPFGPGSEKIRVIMRCKGPEVDNGEGTMRSLAASRTLKYFDGILSGAWVISPEWVHSSVAAGRWLPEADFELAGDLNGGLGGPANGRRHGPSLFAGLRLHFAPSQDVNHYGSCAGDEDSGPSPEDLERLARRAGAEVLSSICRLPDAQEDPPHLALETREAAAKRMKRPFSFSEGQKAECPALWWRKPILVLPNDSGRRRQRGNQSRSGHAAAAANAGWVVVTNAWMLDCMSRCEIVPPASKECSGK